MTMTPGIVIEASGCVLSVAVLMAYKSFEESMIANRDSTFDKYFI